MRRWVREPLLHFLLLGAVLFVLGAYLDESSGADNNRITVTMTDVERLAALWERQWNRPPTPAELRGLVEDYIKEEVLVREAVAMSLDRDDAVIRRRLAQKMDFLSSDLADQAVPTEAELRTWFEANGERYESPPRVTFTHVYFSPDVRGDETDHDIADALAVLGADGDTPEPWRLGDRFMLPHAYELRPTDEIDRRFGGGFGAALTKVDVGRWTGPIPSGFGLHVVRVEERRDGGVPTFASVRRLVERDLTIERRAETNEAFYQQLRSRYDVAFDEEIQTLAGQPVPTGTDGTTDGQ